MTLVHVSGPAVLPVSMPEVRLHCRIDSDEEDFIVEGYVRDALQLIERVTGTVFEAQTWRWHGDAFPAGGVIDLGIGPVTAVASVLYIDEAGAEQTLDTAEYRADLISPVGRIILAGSAWPATTAVENAVTVEFTAGLGRTPEPVRSAIMLMVARSYHDREGMEAAIGPGVIQRIAPYRRVMV